MIEDWCPGCGADLLEDFCRCDDGMPEVPPELEWAAGNPL